MTESSRFFLVLIGSLVGVFVVTQIIGFLWMLFTGSWEAYKSDDIPTEQRRQSLRETWNGEKPKGDLVGATIGWTPGDEREKVEREGMPTEYGRKLPYKTKAEAWSKQK